MEEVEEALHQCDFSRAGEGRQDLVRLRELAADEAVIGVGFICAITKGQRGSELTEAAELAELGAVALSDDGYPVSNAAEQHYGSAALQTLLDQLRASPGGAPTQALIAQAAAAIDTAVPTINIVAIPVQNVTRADVTGYAAYSQPVTYYEHLHPVG